MDNIERWLEEQFVSAFRNADVAVTPSAKALFALAVRAQVAEGLVSSEDEALRLIELIPPTSLPEFYIFKYGARPLTFNRAVRLLADLHDRWISIRESGR